MTESLEKSSEQARKDLLDQVEQLIEAGHFEELRLLLSEARSSEVAEVVEVLDENERQILFDLLDPRLAGEVLEKIDEATRSEVVEDMTSDELSPIVATLPPDEAADVVGDLSEEQSEEVLEQISRSESAKIEKLLGYDEDSAGGIMNTEMITVEMQGTIRDAIHNYRQADPEEDFFFIFVVDEMGKYKGSIYLPDLLRYSRSTPVSEVIDTSLPMVCVDADQEEIANIFRKNDLIVMPVVDTEDVLLGRITVDDVVDVVEEEAEEDALVMAGTHPTELETNKPFRAASIRLPWLLTCMVGSLFSGMILFSFFALRFQNQEWICIVMFVPAIAAMGGNSGTQTSTIVVRGLASNDLAALDFIQVFIRESRVALIVAGICGILSGVVSGTWLSMWPKEGLSPDKAPILGLAVGLAMFCGIMLSTGVGMSLPFMFRRIGIDPAIAAGPLVTTANDAIGYITYFSLALLLLHLLGG